MAALRGENVTGAIGDDADYPRSEVPECGVAGSWNDNVAEAWPPAT
jgi:hypothetical protein